MKVSAFSAFAAVSFCSGLKIELGGLYVSPSPSAEVPAHLCHLCGICGATWPTAEPHGNRATPRTAMSS